MTQNFQQKLLDDLSPIVGDLAYRYSKISEQFDIVKADNELKEIHRNFVINDLNLCDSAAQLREQSKKIAEQCRQYRGQNDSLEEIYKQCVQITEEYRVSPPEIGIAK